MTVYLPDTRPIDASFHHPSHRKLLTSESASDAPRARIDAVVVPSARPVRSLRRSMKLAQKLKCGLLAMCSKAVTAREAARLGTKMRVPVVAMDVVGDAYGLPAFLTSCLVEEHTEFTRPSDTSLKRNLALYLSRLAGWRRVLFLDDDIYDVPPVCARAAAGLLRRYDVVGLNNEGYPDNSVVCHLHRKLGGDQSQFIGVGGMAISPLANRSFFPNIYNQDWFFVLGTGVPLRIAVTGKMKQKRYDPFADADRARREEFGDCLAEGLFWLLDNGLPIQSADEAHWEDFLGRRAHLIGYLSAEAKRKAGTREGKRVRESMHKSWMTWRKITPRLCADYVRWWQSDIDVWRLFLLDHPVGLGLKVALDYTGWHNVFRSEIPWPHRASSGVRTRDRLGLNDGWQGPAAGSKPNGKAVGVSEPSRHTPAPAEP